MRVPAQTASVQLPWKGARKPADEARYQSKRQRDCTQSALQKRKTTGMAQRGVGLKGRTIVGLLLGAFLVVALSIVWRRTIGISESRRLTALEATRAQLESERARVQSDIRDASTRQHLGSVVETRLGMHVPSDKQVVILPRQGASETP